ncbi:hypothetical protein C1631_001615 [Chryseobacterium phosphatilyticum]|uniref:Uncharacterized protein n=1 Tax=Chryseobacterium phosphatilyticum TaxID=475075 RepID=A0A316XF40_9FLAO|nr:hypothetical protein [Chryseobacterium phosphatilyticum]PWN71346.1 hypothetical protein C1631_001615 [Chryseobacterium phosphatilyticum]
MTQKNIEKFTKIKDKYFAKLEKLGIKSLKLNTDFQVLKLDVNNIDGLKNFIWRKFNSIVKENDRDFNKLQHIYFEMEQFLKNEQKGKDSTYVRALFFEALIKYNKEISKGVLLEVVIIGKNNPNICDVCKNDNGKTFNFDYALNNHILPHKDCMCKSGCICNMGISSKRDSHGKLIYLD